MFTARTTRVLAPLGASFCGMNVCRPLRCDQQEYDAVVVGGGHNGLVAAGYLARAGKKVLVCEQRYKVGGCCITEEVYPGFKFSRASYVMGLIRPTIVKDLELKKYGFEFYSYDPYLYAPFRDGGFLLLGSDGERNKESVAKFSKKDAEQLEEYEAMLGRVATIIEPLLDVEPLDLKRPFCRQNLVTLWTLWRHCRANGIKIRDFLELYDLMTASASTVLHRWFESPELIGALANGAIIGEQQSPDTPGSAYVLFHLMMGEVDGVKGLWGHMKGGMGAITQALCKSAQAHGAEVSIDTPVKRIVVNESAVATGVELMDGTVVKSKVVLTNTTPEVTLKKLIPGSKELFPEDVVRGVTDQRRFRAAQVKVNLAVSKMPEFRNKPQGLPDPDFHLKGSAHLGALSLDELRSAYQDAENGQFSKRPYIEFTVPTTQDKTIAPPGQHVVLLFIQYAPYLLENGSWDDPKVRQKFLSIVYDVIEEQVPGFRETVLYADMLAPPDLERLFGISGGHIYHGSLTPSNLYFWRPHSELAHYTCAPYVKGLYLCGSGSHPGGGVMGAPGRNCALRVLREWGLHT